MKIYLSIFLALILLSGCHSDTDSNSERYWKSSRYNNLLTTLDENPALGKQETRLWIDFSMMDVAELYKLDQRKMYVKMWNDQTNVPTSDTITIDREIIEELQVTIDQINAIDSPSECDYCNKVGDGALIIYESWHGEDFIIKERNLGELDYPSMILDSGLGNADELRLLFKLIDMLELKKTSHNKKQLQGL